jgi:hypothetical protein
VAKSLWSQRDTIIALGIFGGSLGAAGWIFGAASELMAAPAQPNGIGADIFVVVLCAVGVLLTGTVIWCQYLSGRRLSVFFMVETLLGASLMFGTAALFWIHARGLLPLVVQGHSGSGQPGNEIWEAIGRHVPPEMAYLAPLIILAIMLVLWWNPIRRRLIGSHAQFQRSASDSE